MSYVYTGRSWYTGAWLCESFPICMEVHEYVISTLARGAKPRACCWNAECIPLRIFAVTLLVKLHQQVYLHAARQTYVGSRDRRAMK